MLERPDKLCVSQYLTGDEESLSILIRRWLKPVYHFIFHYVGNAQDAEDITQEVFLRLWRNLKKFDPKKSFKTWLFSIAKNAVIDFLRKKKVLPFSAFENEAGDNPITDSLADPAPLPSQLWERSDLADLLKAATEKLSANYRVVLFLRYHDGFTFREIAEILGDSTDTIKSRHRRALIYLRKLLNPP